MYRFTVFGFECDVCTRTNSVTWPPERRYRKHGTPTHNETKRKTARIGAQIGAVFHSASPSWRNAFSIVGRPGGGGGGGGFGGNGRLAISSTFFAAMSFRIAMSVAAANAFGFTWFATRRSSCSRTKPAPTHARFAPWLR